MKNVQKFHPGICLCPSERLTSSSRCVTAASNADKMPSLTLVTRSAQTVGLSLSALHTSCTHLNSGRYLCIQRCNACDIPVLLVRVEVCLHLVEHGRLHLEQPALSRALVGTDNMDDEPFLVFALGYRCMPLFDLFPDRRAVCLTILERQRNEDGAIQYTRCYSPRI